MLEVQRARNSCEWMYCFGEQAWERYLLEAGFRLAGCGATWPELARNCANVLLPSLSDETRRIVGEQWIPGQWADEQPWFAACFNYALVLPAARTPENIGHIKETARKLEDADPDSTSPAFVRARELFDIGMRRLSQGLIEKAVESFRRSEQENELNFLLHLQLGKLYLYGVDEYVNVIDLPQAERHLRASARFARLHPAGPSVCNEFAAEAYFHAGVACYAQASAAVLSREPNRQSLFLETGLSHLARAVDLSPALAEAHYHRAKLRARLGQGEPAIEALRTAVLADPNYCLKADVDPDFALIRPLLLALFEELRQEMRLEFATVATTANQFRSRNGLVVLSSKALDTVKGLEQAPLLPGSAEAATYFSVVEEFRRVRSLHSSLQSLLRQGLVGDPAASRKAAEQRIEEACLAFKLAGQVGLASESEAFKLRELRQSLTRPHPYYADIAADAQQLREKNINSIRDYFRHVQSTATGRLEKTRDEMTYAQLAENECQGVFGGAGIIGMLAGAGVGGILGFFLGPFFPAMAIGMAVALGWLAWTEGVIGRIRWRRIARQKAAELELIQSELAEYAGILGKCTAGTLTAGDLSI